MSTNAGRFHYSMDMELADWEFSEIRRRPSGMAGAFTDPKYFRKRVRAIINKIRKRVQEIAGDDEMLRDLLKVDLDLLEGEVKKATESNNNDLELVAKLLRIIAHLLGWAYGDGEFHRTPIYWQTLEQRQFDLQRLAGLKNLSGLAEAYVRRQTVKRLLDEGHCEAMVALVLNTSIRSVRALKAADHIDDFYRREMEHRKKTL
jgi:hypothetical protein